MHRYVHLHTTPYFKLQSKGWFFLFLLVLALLMSGYIILHIPSGSSEVASQNFEGPIIITKGGTYSGNWESWDSDVPAVDIRTAEPVVIINSRIRGAGVLIHSMLYGADITVRHTEGYGLPPTPYTQYEKPRRFLAVDEFKNVVVEHCYLQETAGIYLGVQYTGNGRPEQSVKIRYNKARDINGQIHNGKYRVQFVQFNYRGGLPYAEIAWNEVINRPGHSAVEDNINIYNSRGTPSSPIRIHNNYIQGAFPYPLHQKTYTGGGIISDSPAADSLTATAYLKVYDNHLVGLGNYCLAIAGGNNIEMRHNRAIVAATFDNGEPYHFWTSGIWAKDYYRMHTTFNNSIHHNMLAVLGETRTWRNEISDSTFVAAAVYANIALPDNINKQLEQQEYRLWQEKLRQNNIKIGPKQDR